MKKFLTILLIFIAAQTQAQLPTGYVLQRTDGTIALEDSAITTLKISGLHQFVAGKLKTINNIAIWGVGNFSLLAPNGDGSLLTGLTKSQIGLSNVDNTSDANKPISTATQSALNGKQATLVSATNIKTVNGNTLLGSGDIVVGGGATSSTSGVAATATASGTQTITHNLGRTPTIIRIYSISSFTSNAAATPVPFSTGVWNSSGNRCVYMVINGTTTQVSQTSTVFSVIMVTSAGNQITGVIGNVTNTGFDIVWSETGTHTAGNFLWEAQ